MPALGSLLLLLALATPSWGLCPQPAELLDIEGNRICARLYSVSSVYYDQCCGGDFLDVAAGEDVPFIDFWWNNRISSLVVGTRCELTVWQTPPKNGDSRKFTSGVQYRLAEVKRGLFGNWDNTISSYYCKCN